MEDSTNTDLTQTVENAPTTDKLPQHSTMKQLTESERHFIFGIETKLALNVPPPNVIKDYQEIYPDAAQTFFVWAEEEGSHRREMDKLLAMSQTKDSRLGIILGFLISLAGLAVAAFAVYMHEPWIGSIVGGGTIVALARAFIVGKNNFHRPAKKQ